MSTQMVSPKDDAIVLYYAFKGHGCDTGAIVDILAHRNVDQRFRIQLEYRDIYSHDLLTRLSSELSGHVKRAILLWMPDSYGRDAIIVRESLSVETHNMKAVTEVICSLTPDEIYVFKQRYFIKYGVTLERDIELHVYGDLKKLLIAYVTTIRYDGLEVDPIMVEKDAEALYNAGEKKLGTDKYFFIDIFSKRSKANLAAVSSAYHKMFRTSLKKAIKSETSGNFEFGLLTILRCAVNLNPAKYYAKVLYKSLEGLGTDYATLTRVVVSRAEIDMKNIKAEYLKKYKKPLSNDIHSETSSYFRTFILTILCSSD